VKSIRTGIEAAFVAAKMRRLNLKQQNDDNREVAELRLSAVLELLEDTSYVLQEETAIVKRLRLEVVVRQIQQTTTSELECLWDLSYALQGDRHVKRLKLDDDEHSENARLLSSDLMLPEDLPC